MKNFMSSVYIKPNPVSDEKVCVGLFVGGADNAHFALSTNKLKVVNSLLPKNVYHSLKKSLESLEHTVTDKKVHEPAILFNDKIFTSDYFSYLNKYNKGLLNFSEPSTIGKSIDTNEFARLFELYVGEPLHKNETAKSKPTLKKLVNEFLKKDVFIAKADIHYTLNNAVVSSIYTERSIDFISCNGNIFAGKSIDFNMEPKSIENHLFEYRIMVEGLTDFAARKKLSGRPKFIAYHNEPDNAKSKELLYLAAKDRHKPFVLAEVEELDKAENVLSHPSYRKFSEIL